MTLFQWLTIAASLVVGLGAAFIAGLWQSKRSKRDDAKKRTRALIDYERVLTDIHDEVDRHVLEGNEPRLYDKLPASAESARAAAYYYFREVAVEQSWILKFPFGYELDGPEVLERLTDAIDILRSLTNGPSPTVS